VASLATWVVESLLFLLLTDDRIARDPERYATAVEEELAYVANLSFYVYEKLASFTNGEFTGRALYSKVMQCSMRAVAYLGYRIYDILEAHPWTLITGAESLATLRISERPVEQVAAMIWQLLRMKDFTMAAIDEALHLGRQSSWASKAVEEGHASTTGVGSDHPQYGAPTLLLHAGAHSCRALFSEPPDPHPTETRLQRKLDRVTNSMPQRASGQSLWTGAVAREIARQMAEAHVPYTQELCREAFGMASLRWRELSGTAQAAHNSAQDRKTGEDDIALREGKAYLDTAIDLARKRRALEDNDPAPPVRLSRCRLSADVRDALEATRAGNEMRGVALDTYRKDALTVAEVKDSPLLRSLVPFVRRKVESIPDRNYHQQLFVTKVANRRYHFEMCVFELQDPGQPPSYHLFNIAIQQPLEVMSTPLMMLSRHHHLRRGMGGNDLHRIGYREHQWRFHPVRRPQRACWLPLSATTVIYVIPNFLWDYGHQVYSNLDKIEFEDFIRPISVDKSDTPKEKEPRTEPSILKIPRHRHAWLDHSSSSSGESSSGESSSSHGRERENPVKVDIHIDDATMDKAMQKVLDDRMELERNAPYKPSLKFYVTVRRAKANVKKTGEAGDCTRAGSVNHDVTNWLKNHGLSMTCTCYYSQYPRDICRTLCYLWCHRMTWLYNEFQNTPVEEITDGDLLGYQIPDWAMEGLRGASDECQTRFDEILSCRPRKVDPAKRRKKKTYYMYYIYTRIIYT